MNVTEVPLTDIQLGDNSRLKMKSDALAELMNSIKVNGLLQPVGVQEVEIGAGPTKYRLIYGYRRYTAMKKLGRKQIPAVVFSFEDEIDEVDITMKNLVENIQRVDINLFDLGRYVDDLVTNYEMTHKEISERLSQPVQRIRQSQEVFDRIPKKYASKTKVLSFGSKTRGGGEAPASVMSKIANMTSKYNLKKDQLDSLCELAVSDMGLSNAQLEVLMVLLEKGLSFNKAVKRMDEIQVVRPSIPMFKDDLDKFRETFGSMNNLSEFIYNSSLMKVRDPLK